MQTRKQINKHNTDNVVLLCACCIKICTNFEALYCLGLMDKFSLLLVYYSLTQHIHCMLCVLSWLIKRIWMNGYKKVSVTKNAIMKKKRNMCKTTVRDNCPCCIGQNYALVFCLHSSTATSCIWDRMKNKMLSYRRETALQRAL